MSIAELARRKFIDNKHKKINGVQIGMPIYKIFPRLGKYIPVIPKGIQIAFSAGSGVGKSNSWVGIILYTAYKLKKLEPNSNHKYRFLIVLLEDTVDKFVTMLYSMILYDKYGIIADGLTLNSFRESAMSNDIESKLEDVQNEIDELLKYCEIVDSIANPTGIYKWCRAIGSRLGTHHMKPMEFEENGSIVKRDVYSHYEPNDPDEHVFVICDNLNNFEREKKDGELLDERQTINRWTREYGRMQLTKHLNWTVINIIQQSSESEKPQFDYRGNLLIDKIKPSLDGFGGSKECQRDMILVFGIFNPNRFSIHTYLNTPIDQGYNIARLKDNFRSIIILKSNISAVNKEIPMEFHGGISLYKELPLPSEIKEQDYIKIENKRK